MEHLIAGKINSWIKKEHWFPKAIHTYYGIVGLIMGLLFLIITLFGIHEVSKPSEQARLETAKYTKTLSVDQKLDYLINEASVPSWKNLEETKNASFFAAFILSIVTGLVISTLANNPPKSYLALSQAAETERERLITTRKLDWMYFIASALTSTVAGVASRYIFKIFFDS